MALALLATAASPLAGGRIHATPPRQITVQGAVLVPSDIGVVFRADVPVSASDGSGVSGADGIFGFTATFTGFPLEIRALIDGAAVRTLATTFVREDVVSAVIEPAYEAAVQILESIGLDRFSTQGIRDVLSAVSARNASTDYSGLDIGQMIALARSIAQDDPGVQRTIADALIEPQDPCDGDCDRDGLVTVNELVTLVNIALGNRPAQDCADLSPGTVVDVSFLVRAIRHALSGCLAA